MREMLRALSFACPLGLLLMTCSARAKEFIHFSPPASLSGPTIARAALGATYLYRGRDRFAGSELWITVAREPAELQQDGVPSASLCLKLFEDELKRQFPDLFALPSALRLRVGPYDFTQLRWSRRDERHVFTGVLACAVLRGHFVAINFGARSDLALKIFPDIRQKLTRLELNF
ncbi:MAG: hypothetical protein KGO50_19770 [Myxococcales bacterium]|nr:hypothetical protein [Myxococcales bacterium]